MQQFVFFNIVMYVTLDDDHRKVEACFRYLCNAKVGAWTGHRGGLAAGHYADSCSDLLQSRGARLGRVALRTRDRLWIADSGTAGEVGNPVRPRPLTAPLPVL